MAKPRAPRGDETRRKQETSAWRKQWTELQRAHRKERDLNEKTLTRGRSETYRHLWTVYEATQSEVLAAALLELEIYQLDKPNWRRKLNKLARFEQGGSQADFAIGLMRELVERQSFSILRGAQHATAEHGLFRDANSYDAAVQQCREAWRAYKAGHFELLGDLRLEDGYYVRPRPGSLRPGQVRQLRDPHTMQLLPPEGMRVGDSLYWQAAIRLGFVEVIDDPDHL